MGESLYWMRIIKAMLAEGKGVREVEFSDGVLRLYAFTPVSYMGADIYMVICINKDKLFASATVI